MLRALSYLDLEWITKQLRALPSQSEAFRDVPDDPAYVKVQLQDLMRGTLFGAVHEDTESFIMGVTIRPWYADRVEVHEMILWVPEQYRGAHIAYPLIRKFTELAMDENPHSIHVGASLDITSADRTLMLYERAGYTRQGTGAIMRL